MTTVLDRFMDKVELVDTGCYEWTAGCCGGGYGVFFIDRVSYRAHRIAWELLVGDIPEGKWVLHDCDNPKCVNPDHLYIGSHQDNVDDMVRRGRTVAKLTRQEVDEIRYKYASGLCSAINLGDEYGVHRNQIHRIIRRERWR